MSAILAVHTPSAIFMLTDGASIWRGTGVANGAAVEAGTVAAIGSKQATTRNGVAIAGIGIWKPVGPRFAELIDERTKSFDEAILAVRELWGEARTAMPQNALDLPYAIPYAGWSDARQALELHYVTTPIVDGLPDTSDPTAFKAYGPVSYYGGGPIANDAGRAFATLFSKQVQRDPASFNPRRDGMTFMLFMRLCCPRPYGETLRHCVGGHVELTTVTRDSIKTEVIHEWPDRVGQFIEVPKATTGSVAPERHAQAQEAAGSGSV